MHNRQQFRIGYVFASQTQRFGFENILVAKRQGNQCFWKNSLQVQFHKLHEYNRNYKVSMQLLNTIEIIDLIVFI